MFAARFDPLALVQQQEQQQPSSSDEDEISNSSDVNDDVMKSGYEEDDKNDKKRKHDDDSDSGSNNSDSNSDSDSDEEEEEEDGDDNEKQNADDNLNKDDDEMDVDKDESKEDQNDEETNDEPRPEVNKDDKYIQSHSSVFKRFQKTMNLQTKIQESGFSVDTDINTNSNTTTQPDSEPTELKDIAPLPQPALPKDKSLHVQTQKNKTLNWLAEPTYHKTTLTKPFTDFTPAINTTILTNLQTEFGITDAFAVQISLIESLSKDTTRNKLDPTPLGDYLVNASTGSGKTLAYLIPIVNELMTRTVPKLRCIVLVPTKPLVNQVYSTLLKLTKGVDLNCMAFKNDVGLNDEHEKFVRLMPDVVVTAPGRLVDHIVGFDLWLGDLRFCVVDEADRLLNQSFQNWCDLLVSKIERDQRKQQLPPQPGSGSVSGSRSGSESSGVSASYGSFYNRYSLKCIKLILSATLTTNSEKLSHLKLFKPKVVVVNDVEDLVNELYQLPPNLEEYYLKVPESLSFYKPLILLYYLLQPTWNTHGLIFAKSNESAIRLTRLLTMLTEKLQLTNQLRIKSVNSTIGSQARLKILKDFDLNGGVLIATDLIARGLNLESIQFVVNYDLPLSTKEYVHRIGRTARANRAGSAVSFVYGDGEFRWFKKLVYSGGVINRNKKVVHEIDFVKEKVEGDEENGDKDDEEMGDIVDDKDTDGDEKLKFALTLSDEMKQIYENSLKELESEVYRK
ncbi:unnamed protein product [Ambrosiozyma monospora]|uniref:Unnamed protein product n=1 Tax=Ambrosiozyma monospora TaxID=43982 RepID=A0ACB5SZ04_AMBMO|nr:unnamed protein product [Ambrosiozyma monospora]